MLKRYIILMIYLVNPFVKSNLDVPRSGLLIPRRETCVNLLLRHHGMTGGYQAASSGILKARLSASCMGRKRKDASRPLPTLVQADKPELIRSSEGEAWYDCMPHSGGERISSAQEGDK
jgi:hypothetical protein